MTSITVTDVPASLSRRLGKKVTFSRIQGLYWDGMDRIQYDEVIPTEKDQKMIEKTFDEKGNPRNPEDRVSFDDIKKSL
jgi:hypothetical protein